LEIYGSDELATEYDRECRRNVPCLGHVLFDELFRVLLCERLRNVRQVPDELPVISVFHGVGDIARLEWPKQQPVCAEFDPIYHG